MEEERGWGSEGNRDKPPLMRVTSVLFNVPHTPRSSSISRCLSACLSVWGSDHYSSTMPVVGMRSSFIVAKKSWFRVGTWGESWAYQTQPPCGKLNSTPSTPSTPARPPVVASTPSTIPHPGRAVRPISSARIHDGVGAGILCSCVPRSLHHPTSPTLQGWGAGHCSEFRGSVAGEGFLHLVESRSPKARRQTSPTLCTVSPASTTTALARHLGLFYSRASMRPRWLGHRRPC